MAYQVYSAVNARGEVVLTTDNLCELEQRHSWPVPFSMMHPIGYVCFTGQLFQQLLMARGGVRAGVMGLMSVWVAGLGSERTGQFGAMSKMMPPQVLRALEAGALFPPLQANRFRIVYWVDPDDDRTPLEVP